MRILIAGGTGYLGSRLVGCLATEGHELIVLTRRRDLPDRSHEGKVRHATWRGRPEDGLTGLVDGCDAVVNLSGESIAGGRWTGRRKAVLRESRIGPTRALVQAIERSGARPRVLVNASAVAIYGNVDEGRVTESHSTAGGFLADLCREWEAAANGAVGSGVRVATMRTGVVIGPGSEALRRMVIPFRFFVGGPLGSGRQWLPWIHIDDVAAIIRFILLNETVSGPVNVTAPGPVRMTEFSRELGRTVGRPSWLPVPAFALRIAVGEMAEMLLGGHCVVPEKLTTAGYRFTFPDLRPALSASFSGK